MKQKPESETCSSLVTSALEVKVESSVVKKAVTGLAMVASLTLAMAGMPTAASASAGCDAVNAGAWDISITSPTTYVEMLPRFMFVAGEKISVTLTTSATGEDPGGAGFILIVPPYNANVFELDSAGPGPYPLAEFHGEYTITGVGDLDLGAAIGAGDGGPGSVASASHVTCTPVEPVQCQPGTFSATGFSPCAAAQLGYYVDHAGATAASPAPIGYYVDQLGQVAPSACPAGTTTLSEASVSAASCVGGDTVAPNISWVGGPALDASYVFGSVPAAPTCVAVDEVSGPAACSVSGYSNSVGAHTMTATATDAAGNVATVQRTYSVAAWTLSGFAAPIDMLGAVNVVKNGATVVLKFEVLAGASKLSDVSVVEAFTVGEVACATLDLTANELPIDQLSTAQTALRYDTTAGQFVQHWRTPKKASACYRVTLATKDGSSLVAYFQLR